MLPLVFLITVLSCKSQNTSTSNLDSVDLEVIELFLGQMGPEYYADKHLFYRNRIDLFSGKYRYHQQFYINADSICKNDKDTLRLKFYCPLADTFKKFDGLLNEEDLSFLRDKYDLKKEKIKISLDSMWQNVFVLKHSDDYYSQVNYNEYRGIPDINEFPSIQIENLYYNERRDVAIIAYAIVEGPSQGVNSFFLFKKIRNIWWKPIGAFKI